MRKGDIVTVLTNLGASGYSTIYVGNTGYGGGTTIVDVLTCTFVIVDWSGTITVVITEGLPKVSLIYEREEGEEA